MEEEEELRTSEGEEDRTPSLDASVLLLLLKQHYRGLELRSRLHVYTLRGVLLGPFQGPAVLALHSEAIYP